MQGLRWANCIRTFEHVFVCILWCSFVGYCDNVGLVLPQNNFSRLSLATARRSDLEGAHYALRDVSAAANLTTRAFLTRTT
eukprot:1184032-Prorocentrum_minimum.AAC.4